MAVLFDPSESAKRPCPTTEAAVVEATPVPEVIVYAPVKTEAPVVEAVVPFAHSVPVSDITIVPGAAGAAAVLTVVPLNVAEPVVGAQTV